MKGWKEKEWGDTFRVDVTLDDADAGDYDALLLPGGVMNPDKLRMSSLAVQFVRAFINSGKPVAAICHGPWMLVEADALRGRTVTSWPSLQTDIRNAGGNWVDEQVVTDSGIVTSRKPDDIPAFNRKMIEEIAEGRHDRRSVAPSIAGTLQGSQATSRGTMGITTTAKSFPIAAGPAGNSPEHIGRGDQRPEDVGAPPDREAKPAVKTRP